MRWKLRLIDAKRWLNGHQAVGGYSYTGRCQTKGGFYAAYWSDATVRQSLINGNFARTIFFEI